jgi:hypothetical protein
MKPLSLALAILLSSSALFAAADLSITAAPAPGLLRAGFSFTLYFTIHNAGPDAAKDVNVSVASNNGTPVDCHCSIGDIAAGASSAVAATLTPPAGTITITATVTSSTADDNASNNTTSQTLTVSGDPDVVLTMFAPQRQDLGLPFTLQVNVGNGSKTAAHNVDVTIDFPFYVSIRTLPDGCTSPGSGRVVCHIDVLPASQPGTLRQFDIGLVAPNDFGSATLVFTGIALEAEHDFDPINNTARATTALYRTFYVGSTANDGPSTLRQAILDANAGCGTVPCAIAFRIQEASATPWKTIHIVSPLPPITTAVRIDGATQSALVLPANTKGPDIEISGGPNAGDGLVIAACGAEVANLAINGFPGNGISITWTSCQGFIATTLHHLFIGTDPTGAEARPNLRGIGTSAQNGTLFTSGPQGIGAENDIHDCVISGNLRSGVFDLSARVSLWRNRIGVKAHADETLPNGNAGVYIGPGGYGSDVGPNVFAASSTTDFAALANVIAFNGQMGVAVAAGTGSVGIRHNRIWGNAGLGIDIGLDGAQSGVPGPVITLAHYDPVSKQTLIEGDATRMNDTFGPRVDLYANDAPDPSGFGEAQRPLGNAVFDNNSLHFHLAVSGDLTGQFITGTTTHVLYVGFAKPPEPNGIDQGFLSSTSELSRPVEVR